MKLWLHVSLSHGTDQALPAGDKFPPLSSREEDLIGLR